jgi:hypothetical protein
MVQSEKIMGRKLRKLFQEFLNNFLDLLNTLKGSGTLTGEFP